MTPLTHSEQIGRDCVKRVARDWGKAWRILSTEMQEAQVCRELVSILLMMHEDCSITHPQEVCRQALKDVQEGTAL